MFYNFFQSKMRIDLDKPIFQMTGSITTANNLKQSGKIDKAITKVGRKIVVNKEKLLTILSNNK